MVSTFRPLNAARTFKIWGKESDLASEYSVALWNAKVFTEHLLRVRVFSLVGWTLRI